MPKETDTLNILSKCTGFDWDGHNSDKNWVKHCVSSTECEQVFFNVPLLIFDDTGHSLTENRFYVLGSTDKNRNLFIVFTIRNQKIRIISARDMNAKERGKYGSHK
ncbi:MAG: BrnT family toxin [Deltaproteobacteria bacterium]